MGVETSPTFTFTGQAAAYDPDADVKQSPLWPLQSAIRQALINFGGTQGTTFQQIAVLQAPRNELEGLFAQWRSAPSLTGLRAVINYDLSPPYLNLVNDPVLVALQNQLLALPNWNDSLPS